MPCEIPYRDDSSQRLLFKIAACLAEGGAVAGVASFNGRTGLVTLTSGDVTTALGFVPISQATGDSRYVLRSGDTMTGSLNIANSAPLVASDPALDITQTWNNGAVTFTGLLSNITNTASDANSNLFNFQVGGVDRFNFTPGGSLRAVRQDASDSGMNLFLRKRGNAGGATNALASDATIGTVAYSGWNGAAFVTGSRISGLASEVWTGIANGSRIDLYTTPIGSVTEQITLRLDSTGQAKLLDGTAALPALTFQSDPDTGIYRIGANSFGLSAGGAVILDVATDGVNLTTALAYQYNAVNVIRAQTALDNFWFGNSGNLTGTGGNNLGFGAGALVSNTTGIKNVAIGFQALALNTTGQNNIAIGINSLIFSASGSNNTGIGVSSLGGLLSGSTNVAIGNFTLGGLTTGSTNTGIGYNTGIGITTGSNNTILGANVTGLAAALSNNIILADGAGVIRLQIDSSGNTTLAGTLATADGTAALPGLAFAADTNTGLYRIGADILGFSTAGTARWQISAAGHFLATTDNSFDIGASGATRPRSIFVGTNISAADTVTGSQHVIGVGDVIVGNGAGALRITNPSAGVYTFDTVTPGSFARINIGGATSSFPAIKRSAATLQFRLADDSAFADIATAAIVMSTAAPLSITSGANQRCGDAVLVGGTVTVANTTVTANTRVFLTRKVAGGTIGFAVTYTLIAATSFTITSDNVLDTSTYSYLLIEVP